MDTAKSWDSYMDSLFAVLDELKPKNILEFGSGKSTKVMALYPTVESVFTIEHDKEWFHKIAASPLPGLTVKLIQNLDEYAYGFPKDKKFDFVFVDGRNRARCMKEAMPYITGALMLHDAQREEYREAINEWPYQIWTDDGHTVTLTIDEDIHKRLSKCLDTVQNFIGVKG